MKKISALILIFAAFALPLLAFNSMAGNGPAEHGRQEHPEGALLDEMRSLDRVFREVVSYVALGNSAAVVEVLDHMHGKMEATEEALHSKKLHLPKNPGKVVLFKKLDSEFHAELRMLEKAARDNDQDNMVAITQRLLARCVTCHNTFRK